MTMSEVKDKKKYDLETAHVPDELKKAFPDYPCTECPSPQTCRSSCAEYKEWLKVTWKTVTDRLKGDTK